MPLCILMRLGPSPRSGSPPSAQRLPNGNTVVGFSYVGVVTEVTPSGSVVWDAQLSVDGQTNLLEYRLLKIPTLGHLRP